jgi:pyridoxine 5-phosphate synthase
VTVLSVNLNKVALLRNSRLGEFPSVTGAARIVIAAGAGGITVHPRPDQRHIRAYDVPDLAAVVAAHPGIEYNIEGNPFAGPRDDGYPGFDALVAAARPDQVTLVPDSDSQLTSDHGWDLTGDTTRLRNQIARYQRDRARVSLFIDPDTDQISRARDVGADRIELYTGPFADAVLRHGLEHHETLASFERYRAAAAHAIAIGLGVNAGHDLDRRNLTLFRRIPGIAEVSIGHALIGDALELGLAATVRAYLAALDPSNRRTQT